MSGLLADVRARLGPIRDQGRRPTCLAFALSCGHRGARAFSTDFSAEGLHTDAARSAGRTVDRAVPLASALSVLATQGQVEEAAWPYGSAHSVVAGADLYLAASSPLSFDATMVEVALQAGSPVVAGLEIGLEFFHAQGEPLTAPTAPLKHDMPC